MTTTTSTTRESGQTGESAGVAVRLVDLRDRPLSVEEVLAAVSDPAAGGVDLFVGVVRDHDHGHPVTRLEYTAHPSALNRLREVAEAVAGRHAVVGVAVVHRTGQLRVGDDAVILAVSASHRGEAFAASRDLIDTLKQEVPIWKRQVFADGAEEWVNCP